MDSLKVPASPRGAVVWSVLTAELAVELECAAGDCRIVDVGGGTGGFAVPLAQAGYPVTVVDPSPNALAGLTRRAREAGVAERITAVQGDADALADVVPAGGARLVLCHSVLEMVDSPEAAVSAVSAALAPGGAVSIVVASRAGAVLTRALGGQPGAATALLSDAAGRAGDRDTLLRRFDAAALESLVRRCGLRPEQLHGVGVAADLAAGALRAGEPDSERAMLEFELAASAQSPYRDIAADLHLLARKASPR